MATRALLAGLAVFLPLSTLAQVDPAVEARVRAAAAAVYVHGMTAEIAQAEVGQEGIPSLLLLLDDASFPRRDNVVAFLAYLGGRETTPALLRLLERVSPEGRPEEDRSRLLVPHALGRIASRGETAALDALLSMTAHRSGGGPIAAAAARLRDDLIDAAVMALPLAGEGRARERLEAIAAGRVTPDPARPALMGTAQSALQTLAPLGDERVSQPAEPPVAAAVAFLADPAPRSVAHGITFGNHAGVSSPMTAARLDAVLRESTRRAARGDFSTDVACCLVVSRVGAGPTFGSAGDGLATIDTANELNAVLGHSAGRVKVVNVINYCGGPGTNIIGCGYQPGAGVALVRMSDVGYEAVLWIHEYGHNIGLPHVADTRGLMAARDNGSNDGLSASECARFHNPDGDGLAMLGDAGTCTADGDSFADPIDNCPFVSNEGQADANNNGVGDICETCSGGASDPDGDGVCGAADNCPLVSNPSQADADGDGAGDACDVCAADLGSDADGDLVCSAIDNCPAVPNASQANVDSDPYGDACEVGVLLADVDLSGRVDGFDLARLGRAFGSSRGGSRYDAAVDLDRDGLVDGSDLALLAPEFGRSH